MKKPGVKNSFRERAEIEKQLAKLLIECQRVVSKDLDIGGLYWKDDQVTVLLTALISSSGYFRSRMIRSAISGPASSCPMK